MLKEYICPHFSEGTGAFIWFPNQEEIAKSFLNYKAVQNQVIPYLLRWHNGMVFAPARRHFY